MKPIDRLTELYIAASRRIATATNAALKKRGVSPAQYEALGHLEASIHLTMTQLADAMGHTTAAATGLVDRLVAQGFVERSSIEGDRRRIAVALSESGIVFMDSMRTVIRELIKANLADAADKTCIIIGDGNGTLARLKCLTA